MLRDSNITGIPEHEPSGMQVGVTVDSRILEAAILEAGRCVTVDSRIPGVTILECRAPIFISVCQSRNRGSSIQNAPLEQAPVLSLLVTCSRAARTLSVIGLATP